MQRDHIVEVSLRSHRHLPGASRPVFLLRPLTQRQLLKAEALAEQAEVRPDVRGKLLEDLIDLGLEGWRNVRYEGQAVEWGDDVVGGFLTDGEVLELAGLVMSTRAPKAPGRLRRLLGRLWPGSARQVAAAIDPAAVAEEPPAVGYC